VKIDTCIYYPLVSSLDFQVLCFTNAFVGRLILIVYVFNLKAQYNIATSYYVDL